MNKIESLKKTLVLILTSLLTVTNSPVYATDSNNYELYLKSQSVPSAVTEYAQRIYSNLYCEDIENLGFTSMEASEMKLAPGFCAKAYDSTIDTSNLFYFPVMYGDSVVALFTVKAKNGTYSYQFGKNDLATALNDLETSYNDSVEIVLSETAFYGIMSDNVVVLSTLPESTESIIAVETSNLATASEISLLADSTTEVILISEDTVYSETALPNPTTRAFTGRQRFVPIVDNMTYTSGGTTHGTCWASCTGSLIEYYNDGESASDDDASTMRDTILEDRLAETGSYSGGIGEAETYIEDHVDNVNMQLVSNSLSWNTLKTELLNNNSPCYMRWVNDENNIGHAMVLCGYRYENTAPNDTSLYGIYLMDPNRNSIQLITYGSTSQINDNEYSWDQTLRKVISSRAKNLE